MDLQYTIDLRRLTDPDQPQHWKFTAGNLVLQNHCRVALCKKCSKIFQSSHSITGIFLLQPLHMLYITGTGLLGLQGSYEWKGRRVR